MQNSKLLKMLQSVDAFFPIGAFTMSNGLEDYVMRNCLNSHQELEIYIESFLELFSYQDLGLMHFAYIYSDDKKKLIELDNIAGAMKSAKEVRHGSIRMCQRFIKARMAMNDCTVGLDGYFELIKAKKASGFHSIALGIYCGDICSQEQEKIKYEKRFLNMYGYSVISAIVNNAVKLVPLSQMEGQRILFESLEKLEMAVDKAVCISEDELGASGALFEMHCMKHEKLYSRQYMS